MKSQTNYRGFSRWNIGSKKQETGMHRQYFLDWVASTDNTLTGWVNADKRAKDYHWWLQDFSRRQRSSGNVRVESYKQSDMHKIWDKLRRLPKSGGNGESYSSVGKTRSDYQQPLSEINDKVKLLNLKTWFLHDARDVLLDGLDAETIQELITNSPEF